LGKETLAVEITAKTKKEIWGEMFALLGETTGGDVKSNEHSLEEGIMTDEANGTKRVSLFTEADEVRRGGVCMQEDRQLDEVSQELSPTERKSVPCNTYSTGSSILNEWQEFYLIGDRSALLLVVLGSLMGRIFMGRLMTQLMSLVTGSTILMCRMMSWGEDVTRRKNGESKHMDKLWGERLWSEIVGTNHGEKLFSNRRGVTQDAIFWVCTDSIQLCYGRVSMVAFR
jgi:hypothetical protein